ncbi:hypothetical protein G205_23349 [Arthrobacter nitrophenolicus]|uniref:Uncharacterized protein n=3 Tax=Micrococcaceae TaxID=1268 RepID=A0ACC6TL74_9MICC|nr:hypothetical protein Achl_4581 [Pseudarthrobacter chlorophenolicus A6]ELT42615.1 hypothetical protein G205_23349 [Arthrobacter nitrophenolicus]SDQ10600.1 hypothetical protein SAMN04489738_0146 [Pseudarthrobacter chlorophenolicus]
MHNTSEPRYSDYYCQLSYQDFCARLAAGTLGTNYSISEKQHTEHLAGQLAGGQPIKGQFPLGGR